MLVIFFYLFISAEGTYWPFVTYPFPLPVPQDSRDALQIPDLPNKMGGTCTVPQDNSVPLEGVCIKWIDCFRTGGKSNGFCGFFGVCCTYERSCGMIAPKARISYFKNDPDADNQNCTYRLDLEKNICQVRLDFDKFHLAPATIQNNNASKCIIDHFTIAPNTFGIPAFCGNNDGQHIYIHVPQGQQNQLKFKFHLGKRSKTNTVLKSAQWQLKVHKLECSPSGGGIQLFSNYVEDSKLLAPHGVTQYYLEPSGTFRSFGMDAVGNTGNYVSGSRYSIVFRRTSKFCRFSLLSKYTKFGMAKEEDFVPSQSVVCHDYLFVPHVKIRFPGEAEYFEAPFPQFCLNFDSKFKMIGSPPGPFLINFIANESFDHAENSTGNYGFNFRYRLLECE